MSTRLSQYLFYGVKLPYDTPEFKKLNDDEDYDAYGKAMAYNRKDKTGWLVEGMNGEFVMLGRILLEGEDMGGGDDVIAADGGTVEVPILSGDDKLMVDQLIKDTLDGESVNNAKYYIVSVWG